MKEKVGIIGLFAWGTDKYDGQTIKTLNLYDFLSEKDINLSTADSYQWRKRKLKFFLEIVKLVLSNDYIIMMPDAGGIKVYPFILCVLKGGKKKIYYNVVGAWLPEFTKKSRIITWLLKKFDGILVETQTMKNALEKQGFKNIYIVRNFKKIQPIKMEASVCDEPYMFCIFSRIMKEKGVTDAVNVLSSVNEKYGRIICKLDIYGPVAKEYEEEFEDLLSKNSDFIKYCGVKKPEEAPGIIKDYFMLLFPTLFYTEGIPGTVIDAFCAGVPVLSSEWESCRDVLSEDTAVIYEFGNQNDLYDKIIYCIENRDEISAKKSNCIEHSYDYLFEKAGQQLINILFENKFD